jgi:hypothetical protein
MRPLSFVVFKFRTSCKRDAFDPHTEFELQQKRAERKQPSFYEPGSAVDAGEYRDVRVL